MKHLPFLSLIALVFISGCVTPEMFGTDVIKTNINPSEQGAKDVLVIKDVQTIPKSPLLPGQQFTLFFTVENVDEEKNADRAKVELFNPSVFKNQATPVPTPCAGGNCKPNMCASSCTILPSEQKQIQFFLSAPQSEEIAKIRLETEMHFSVNYDFSASTFFEVPVVTVNEITQRQQAGQSVSIASSKVQSSGPIQTDVEIKGTQFVLAGQNANFMFTVRNRGSKGNLQMSQVKKGKMGIQFPAELFTDGKDGNDPMYVSSITPPDPFVCFNNALTEQLPGPPSTPAQNAPTAATVSITDRSKPVRCVNNNVDINLFKGESVPLKFTIEKTRKDNVPPFATYPIKAGIDYTYELREKAAITVQPFK